MENRNAKSLLAKLMAAENINVEYSEKAATASFDTESRTLRMPVFKDISDDSTDLFLGHEVGHALYTPQGEILKVLEKGGVYKNFVNVVEDARIEKMIQNKFPGLRRCFFSGYNELMERDFFGTNGQDLNDYNFIDRLNLHFKVGFRAGIEFSLEEQVFVNRMENLRTWEDTISLSDDLYEYCKAKNEDEPETTQDSEEVTDSDEGESEEQDMGSGDSGEDSNEQESSTGESDSGEEESESGSEYGSDTQDESGSEGENDTGGVDGEGSSADSGSTETAMGKRGSEESATDEMVTKTQDSFDNKLEEIVDKESFNSYYTVPNVNIDQVVVPMSEVHKMMDKELNEEGKIGHLTKAAHLFKIFSNEQKSIISYLIKEFEMRKSADEHKRTKVSKTGILNPNKLHAFKFSEDIFLRNSVVSDGKNHGFVMFVDWSGSMMPQMADTIDQLMMLAMFCKKTQIPFDVYAFTNTYCKSYEGARGFYKFPDRKNGDLGVAKSFNLLHLISSTLKTSAFNKSMTYVSFLRHMFAYHTRSMADTPYFPVLEHLKLGGTPLNEAIMSAISIVPEFQKTNNVQIVNTIFLTDGEGQNRQVSYDSQAGDFIDTTYFGSGKSVIVDPVTKKHYESSINDKVLLKILKDRTGTTLAGFFISPANKKQFSTDMWYKGVPSEKDVAVLWDSMKDNGFCVVETAGYDEYYILARKNLRIEDNGLDGIKSDMTKGKMKNAFVKARQGKIANKKMLSKFAELVA